MSLFEGVCDIVAAESTGANNLMSGNSFTDSASVWHRLLFVLELSDLSFNNGLTFNCG